MTRMRRVLAAAAACAAFSVATAAASQIPFSTARVASGNTNVFACDPDGVTVTYTNAYDTAAADYRTTTVNVSGIAAACVGRTLSVTVRSTTAVLFQRSTTVTGTSMALAATTPLVSSSIAGWAAAVTG